MSEGEPKLTPTFMDTVTCGESQQQLGGVQQMVNLGTQYAAVNPVFGNLAGFPSSRIVGTGQMPVQVVKRERVAIIGTAPSSRMLAPFNDMTWDIWVCSPGNMGNMPRVDAWFEIHKNLHWPEHEGYGKSYLDWLSKQPFPVFMQDCSYFPHAAPFPADELIQKFGDRFFGSTFAWMVAYAIHRGYKEIGLYGVDMASKDEYIQQRGTFQFWFYKCEELGIKITIPPESDLLEKPTLYGYHDSTRFGRKLAARKQELMGRVAQLENVEKPKLIQQLRNVEDNITYLKGAIEDNEYTTSIWPRGGNNEAKVPEVPSPGQS